MSHYGMNRSSAASTTRLGGVQRPLGAPGNRCSPIRGEDVILCVSVLSKCVLSYCKYGVCSYICSCFPPVLFDLCEWAVRDVSSWRPLWGKPPLPIAATPSSQTICVEQPSALRLNCATQYQARNPPHTHIHTHHNPRWSVTMRDVSEPAVIWQSGVSRNGKVA